jgi:hypothetical protein
LTMNMQQTESTSTTSLAKYTSDVGNVGPPQRRILRTPLTIPQILAWADAHHARTGRWPTINSGRLVEAPSENWNAISAALNFGFRGLPGCCTLTQLLSGVRGHRNQSDLPRLGVRKILKWADAYFLLHGTWPNRESGAIPDSGGESWKQVNAALYFGLRGFPGRSSLAQFLRKWRATREPQDRSKLTVEQILDWADEHYAENGRWPHRTSGGISKTRGQTWRRIDLSLARGSRGLPGGTTLARLLAAARPRNSAPSNRGEPVDQG